MWRWQRQSPPQRQGRKRLQGHIAGAGFAAWRECPPRKKAVDGIAWRFSRGLCCSRLQGAGFPPPAARLGFRFPRKESVGNVIEGKRLPVRRSFDRTESEFRFRFPRRDEKAAGKEDCRLSPVDTGQGEGGFAVSSGKLAQGGKHPWRKAGKVAFRGFAGVEVGRGDVPRVARLGKPAVGGAGEARRIVRGKSGSAGGLLGGFVGFRGLHGFVSRGDRGFPRRDIARGLGSAVMAGYRLRYGRGLTVIKSGRHVS